MYAYIYIYIFVHIHKPSNLVNSRLLKTSSVLTGFDFAAANAKVTANYVELTELPINSILGALRAKKVILPRQKEEIEVISLERKRMEYLLDKIITPSLNIQVSIKFKDLLEVMEQSDDVIFKHMAQKLGTH